MSSDRYHSLTPAQEAVLVALSDQRCANLLASADFVADLTEDAKDFLRDAKPETLKFLKDARDVEISELQNGIELVRAFRTTGRVMRWTIVTLFSTLIGFLLIWDRLSSWARAK